MQLRTLDPDKTRTVKQMSLFLLSPLCFTFSTPTLLNISLGSGQSPKDDKQLCKTILYFFIGTIKVATLVLLATHIFRVESTVL